MIRAAAALVLAALATASGAAAHVPGGSASTEYVSRVVDVRPSVLGFSAHIAGSDDYLVLTNDTGRPLTVFGYEGEPYLRFRGDRVEENVNSPAAYLNSDRFGTKAPPRSASAKAKPRWRLLALSHTWSYHDHRIHWMSRIPPPKVKANPGREQHVFDWKVPVEIGAARVQVVGTLDYFPKKGGVGWWVYGVSAAAGVAIVAAAVVSVRSARRARKA